MVMTTIALASDRYPNECAFVDDVDYHDLSQHEWKVMVPPNSNTAYAVRRGLDENGKSLAVLMHREIMKAKKGECIDHIDHDGLNNMRDNLRKCSHGDNMKNRKPSKNGTSRYKGVYLYARTGKWCASIRVNGKRKWLGYHENEIDAAAAYDTSAKENHGEFAFLNFG